MSEKLRKKYPVLLILSFILIGCAKPIHDAKKSINIDNYIKGAPFNSTKRIPDTYTDIVTELVEVASNHPSGIRLEFLSNTRLLEINAKGYYYSVYINDQPYATRLVDNNIINLNGDIVKITIYYPHVYKFELHSVLIDKGAALMPIKDNLDYRITFYGSSITQGSAADEPGSTFAAITARNLNVDFVNLGFGGSALGELFAADLIILTNPDLIIVDIWANTDEALLKKNIHPSINRLKAQLPNTKLVFTTPFYREYHYKLDTIKKNIIESAVKQYSNIGIYDQSLLYPETTDGTHPTNKGMANIASFLTEAILND